MEANDSSHAQETLELEEGRVAGPRWAQLEEESVRDHRADVAALWCRRIAGLLVWGFVAFIFSQLWEVAWQLKDLKLMGVCLLVTVSLFYVLVKRYQNVRETGLSGVELVRALAVDDSGGVRLRGVSRKARAMCMDFKYDPEGVFRERSAGRGFEMYPTQRPRGGASSGSGSGSSSSSSLRGPSRTKGEGKEEEAEAEEKETAGAGGSRKGNQGRRRGRWPWDRGGRGSGDSSSGQGSDGDGANDTEETPITRGEEQRRRQGQSPTSAATPSGVSGSANEGGSSSSSSSSSNNPDAAELGQPPRPPLPPPPPPPPAYLERDGRQVIRASELNASCSVCLFEYYVDEAVTLLPCGHLYHTECIDIWMRDHVDCPYCRADMNVWCNSGGEFSGAGVYRNQTAAAAAPPTVPTATSRNAGGDGSGGVAGGAGDVPPSTAASSSEDLPS
ncbi:unnamed protein product [Ectocarpus sp. 13 AM-2016]